MGPSETTAEAYYNQAEPTEEEEDSLGEVLEKLSGGSETLEAMKDAMEERYSVEGGISRGPS